MFIFLKSGFACLAQGNYRSGELKVSRVRISGGKKRRRYRTTKNKNKQTSKQAKQNSNKNPTRLVMTPGEKVTRLGVFILLHLIANDGARKPGICGTLDKHTLKFLLGHQEMMYLP